MWKPSRTATWIGVFVTLCGISAATPAAGSTIFVTNTSDFETGSLRHAIASAAPGDTIEMHVSGTIVLTTGTLTIRKNLTIVGPGAASLTILGNGTSRLFLIDTATVSISGVTISNGVADYGGGIHNTGRLTLTDCVLSSNTATWFGGAIFNTGMLTLVRCTATNNYGEYRAGAIYSEAGSTLTIDHSTLSDNAASVGGAIDNHDGTLSIVASTFSGNFANGVHGGAGGAIHHGGLGGSLTIVGSTFASNVAAWEGGAVYAGSGTVTVDNSTIANNTSPCDFGGCSGGGGLYAHSATLSITSSTLSNNTSRLGGNMTSLYTLTTVRNSIIAGGASGPNCYMYFGTEFASGGNNVSDDMSCAPFFTQPGDLNGIAAGLSPSGLQDRGGPTRTISLLASSPTVDRVPLDACTANGAQLTTDQRGTPRPFGNACDSGAFELTIHPTRLTQSEPTPASPIAGSTGPMTFAATLTDEGTIAPIANATIGWSIDGTDAAAVSITSADGVATLSYDPSPLAAGDHTVRAMFARQTVGENAFEHSTSEPEWFQLISTRYAAVVKPPIAADGTSVFRSGRGVVPVKFSLSYDGVTTCDLGPSTIALFQTAGTVVGPVTLSSYTLPADNGAFFRADAAACQYVYNIATAALASGTYVAKILIDNIPVGAATFGIQ
jgi:hypothetical protein